MTTYRGIVGTETDPYAPIVAQLMKALALNPVAITEGAAGAPRIADGALDTTATVAGCAWVRNRYALQAIADWGTIILASHQGTTVTTFSAGATVAGSSLVVSDVTGVLQGSVLSGTWMALGRCQTSTPGVIPLTDPRRICIWLRVG